MSYKTTRLAVSGTLSLQALDETSGTSAADATGGGDTGTASGGILGGATGIPADGAGKAALFAGSGSITPAMPGVFPSGNNPWSVDVWFNPSSVPAGGNLFSAGDRNSGFDGVEIQLNDPTTILVISNTSIILSSTGLASLTGAWHRMTVTWDGTTLKLYVDGVFNNSATGITFTIVPTTGEIGDNGIDPAITGAVAYRGVQDRALTSGEDAALYAAGLAVVPNPPTGLTATPNSFTGAIDLAWTAPASGPTPDSYTVTRSTSTNTETSYHTGVIGTSYSDTGVAVGTHYYYKILSHTTAGGDSTASSEANAIAPAIVVRTVTVQNTDLDITNTPATGSTAISLLTPDNVTPVHTATGKALTILTADPTLDNTGFWSEALIPTGDMTPAGCVYQFTEPGGQITNLSFAYADGPTIILSDHYPTQNIVGQIKIYLSGLEIDGLIDSTLPLTAAISADAVWVGGAGIGQLISSNNPISFAPDGAGNAAVYAVRQSELSTGALSNPYLIVNTRSGTPIAFLAPDTYDDALLGYVDRGVYSGPTTYAAKDVVRDPDTDVPYSSIAGGNIGHNPATSPSFWAPHPGVRITAHAVLPGSSVSPVATESMIATISFAARHHATPTTVQEHFEELAYQTWLASWGALQPPETMSALHVYL